MDGMANQQKTIRSSIKRLLAPSSIAIVGGTWADALFEQSTVLGYEGSLYRVNPSRARSDRKNFFASLEELPEIPDAVFLGVNREATIDLLSTMRKMGAGGGVCLASGFDELCTDEGYEFTEKLKSVAGDIPFLGPNCYGMVNFFDRVVLMPDQIPRNVPSSGVCVISQSGTVAQNIMYSDRSLPLGYVLCVGNQTSLSIHELVNAILEDDRVTAIGIYLEGFSSLSEFSLCAENAYKKGIPIVVVKSGRSDVAKRTTFSHTGAIGTHERYVDALLDRLGVIRCDNLPEFTETLKLLHLFGPTLGRRVAVCGYSGGEMAIASDLAQRYDIMLPTLSSTTEQRLRSILGDRVNLSNPLDIQTFIWRDQEKSRACFSELMLADCDCTILFLDHPDLVGLDSTLYENATTAFFAASSQANRKAIYATSYSESNTISMRDKAIELGVAPLQGMVETFKAINNVAKMREAWSNFLPPNPSIVSIEHDATIFTEVDSKKILANCGLSIPIHRIVPLQQSVAAAEDIGFPVALKIISNDIVHKSDHGGVILNLNSPREVKEAAESIQPLGDTVLVEKMIVDAVAELIIGVDVDPQFGPVILLGAGGIFAELIKDTKVLLPPLAENQVAEALKQLKIFPLIKGFRGQPAGDKDAVIAAVVIVANLAEHHKDFLLELDINPLLVRPVGKGAVVADAFVRASEDMLMATAT
ncbi:MAG: hypothetical protein CL398_06860 [Acidiferrobacteraceae bacterium]|nr:hypothetical protein [Acidiferrobacteraceae bacterium]